MNLYIGLEIIIIIIHSVHRFKQTLWLANFIEYKTKQKSETKTEFKKHFFQIMNIFFSTEKQ